MTATDEPQVTNNFTDVEGINQIKCYRTEIMCLSLYWWVSVRRTYLHVVAIRLVEYVDRSLLQYVAATENESRTKYR